jgi:hypothetical protein
MKALLGCLVLLTATVLFAQNFERATVQPADATRGVGAAIASIGSATPTWFAWKQPLRGRSIVCGRCSLEGDRGFTINGDDNDDDLRTSEEMLLAVRVEHGKVQRLRMFNTSCTIDGNGKTVHLLSNVSTESSIDFLLGQIRNADGEGQLMAALALHDHPRVIPELIALARHDPDTEVRRHAIFWLGQRAGEKAAGELRRAVDDDPDQDVKQHAVFAISQLPRERAVPLLIDLVKTHKNRGVRERAMFWLAQTEDPRALDLIESILMK